MLIVDGYEPSERQKLANEIDAGAAKVYRRVSAYASRELAPRGFGRGKQAVLRILADCDGLSLAGIAETGALDRGNVTRIVASLEEGGYLRREPDPAARHGYRVFLTERGRSAAREMHGALDVWNDELFAGLSDAELAALAGTLERLARRSDELWGRYVAGELPAAGRRGETGAAC